MEKLIYIFQKIEKIIISLEKIIEEEHINLLDSKTNIKKLFFTMQKKKELLNQLINEKKEQALFEKNYNISFPYSTFKELNEYSSKIKDKCIFLNKINFKNKQLIKHKFYLNQNILNIYKYSEKNSIYDINGNLES